METSKIHQMCKVGNQILRGSKGPYIYMHTYCTCKIKWGPKYKQCNTWIKVQGAEMVTVLGKSCRFRYPPWDLITEKIWFVVINKKQIIFCSSQFCHELQVNYKFAIQERCVCVWPWQRVSIQTGENHYESGHVDDYCFWKESQLVPLDNWHADRQYKVSFTCFGECQTRQCHLHHLLWWAATLSGKFIF